VNVKAADLAGLVKHETVVGKLAASLERFDLKPR